MDMQREHVHLYQVFWKLLLIAGLIDRYFFTFFKKWACMGPFLKDSL